MIKRTKGRLLLTLLVITGLAGTINNTALDKQERKFAIMQLKNTRADLLKSVKELTDAQLNFKPASNKWSIKECVFHINTVENSLWGLLNNKMKQPSDPEKRTEITLTDVGLLNNLDARHQPIEIAEKLQSEKDSWLSATEALNAFKEMRNDHLKYVKTTTEDLRHHPIEMPFGWIDSYQLILFIAGHTNRHIRQIEEIRSNPAFPKN